MPKGFSETDMPGANNAAPSQASIPEPPDTLRGVFRTDLSARALYAEGAGIARCLPCAVAVPADTDDLSVLVKWAKQTGQALIPRGSGSGMAAGAVGPGIIVDLSRQKTIRRVDADARTIRVASGAIRAQVDQAAREAGYRFPVDPSSGGFCTIGGMVATNAAGPRSLRFGTTRQWVQGLHCVFDDGTSAWIHRDRPLPEHVPAVARLMATVQQLSVNASASDFRHEGVRKDSSGYGIAAALAPGGHLIDVLVGSEGTLAFFTEVELRLIPVGGATATVLATFGSLEAATECAVEAGANGATACELFDRSFLDIAERGGSTGISKEAEAVLLIEVEADESGSNAAKMDSVVLLCRKYAAMMITTAIDEESARKLWALRYAASPILAQLAPQLRSMQFIEDGCVPPERFPEYVRGVRKALADLSTLGVVFGHAGDAHAHVNPLIDTSNSAWRVKVQRLTGTVCDLTSRLGGTLTGEHGDGRLRAPLLSTVWSTGARAAFANIKAAGDPSGILNPGCKISSAQSAAADFPGVVRYDPQAPPLPEPVRQALDAMERARGWDQFKLGLLL